MRKRISLLIAALMLALTMSFGSVAAFAAPLEECKGGQVLVHTSDNGWQCQTPSDNPTAATTHQGTGDKEGKSFPPKGK